MTLYWSICLALELTIAKALFNSIKLPRARSVFFKNITTMEIQLDSKTCQPCTKQASKRPKEIREIKSNTQGKSHRIPSGFLGRIFIAKVSLTGLGFIKSDLYYSGSTMPLITFIILRKTIANCRRKCCYRTKTAKLSYIGIVAYRQIMSENVSNLFQSYFIALSCCKSRQLQKHSKLIYFFTQASTSSLVYQVEHRK